jgi:hypothetical protein
MLASEILHRLVHDEKETGVLGFHVTRELENNFHSRWTQELRASYPHLHCDS